MTEPDTIVNDEVKRQTVILIFSAVGTAVTVYILYNFADPDAWRTLKMKGALSLKRFANRQAVMWENLADKAATIYNRERP